MIVQATNDRITIRIQANDAQTKKVFPMVLYVPPFPPEATLREIRTMLEEIRAQLQPLLEGTIVSINYSPAGEYFASYQDDDLPKAPSKRTAKILAGCEERNPVQSYTIPFLEGRVDRQVGEFFLREFGGAKIRLRASGTEEVERIIKQETMSRY